MSYSVIEVQVGCIFMVDVWYLIKFIEDLRTYQWGLFELKKDGSMLGGIPNIFLCDRFLNLMGKQPRKWHLFVCWDFFVYAVTWVEIQGKGASAA